MLADFMKVSAAGDPKTYAGKVAWNARNKTPMPLLATGAAAINVATKAVAIARKYLEDDGLELLCQPAFRDRNMGASLALYLTSREGRIETAVDEANELSVSKLSKPAVVAGAVAGRARDGTAVVVSSIGPEAVCNAMVAVCRARIYLEEDKLDIKCVPTFEQVDKEGGAGGAHTMTAVNLHILVEQV